MPIKGSWRANNAMPTPYLDDSSGVSKAAVYSVPTPDSLWVALDVIHEWSLKECRSNHVLLLLKKLCHFPVALWVKVSLARNESPVISLAGHFQGLWDAGMPSYGPHSLPSLCLYPLPHAHPPTSEISETFFSWNARLLHAAFLLRPLFWAQWVATFPWAGSWLFSLWWFLRKGPWLHLSSASLLTCVRHWLDKRIGGRQDGGMGSSGGWIKSPHFSLLTILLLELLSHFTGERYHKLPCR